MMIFSGVCTYLPPVGMLGNIRRCQLEEKYGKGKIMPQGPGRKSVRGVNMGILQMEENVIFLGGWGYILQVLGILFDRFEFQILGPFCKNRY
jgi:hypothetical protein